jgi:ATP-binding cassette subfamily F protein uup
VTHDRFLLDRLSTTLLALDGDGGAEFYAELAQWEQATAAKKSRPAKALLREAPLKEVLPASATPAKKKLSYKEALEWQQMEAKIVQAEGALAAAREELQLPEVVSNPGRLVELAARLEEAEAELHRLFERWTELEAKQA